MQGKQRKQTFVARVDQMTGLGKRLKHEAPEQQDGPRQHKQMDHMARQVTIETEEQCLHLSEVSSSQICHQQNSKLWVQDNSRLDQDRTQQHMGRGRNSSFGKRGRRIRGHGSNIGIEDRASKATVLDEQSYDDHSYDDELDYQAMNYQGQDSMRDGRIYGGNNMVLDQHGRPMMATNNCIEQEHAVTGHPYYEKRCRHHLIEDDPDDIECTFRPRLYAPLGAPRNEHIQVDPLMFSPIKTIKHSPMTKSSIEYHYKRLTQARKGPQVYRKKPDFAGGGPFYQKIACEGPRGAEPVPKSEIEARKKQLIDMQIKCYKEGIKGNDPRFNLVGGTFKGAVTVKTNLHMLGLPEQGLDQKRLRQRNLQGQSFDQKFGGAEATLQQRFWLGNQSNSIRSRTLDTSGRLNNKALNEVNVQRGGRTIRVESEGRPDQSHQLRRSIQPLKRMNPLGQLLTQSLASCYSKATITERFANRGIKNRTEAATKIIASTECNSPTQRSRNHVQLTEDSKGHSSLTRQDLNQKSYMSEAFGVGILKASIENSENTRGGLIRGVPKLVQSNKGLRYATEQEQQAMDLAQMQENSFYQHQRAYQIFESEHVVSEEDEHFKRGYPQHAMHPTLTSKFQEEWYPEGIDPSGQNFLKRSLRDHSYNPNRTFYQTLNPPDLLIPKLYSQVSDPSQKKQRRRIASHLQQVVKEGQFNVIESDFEAAVKAAAEAAPSPELPVKPDSAASSVEPDIVYSPGLTSKGKFYTVVSQRRKESPARGKKQEKLRAVEEQMAQQNPDEVQGSDALNVDHGFYEFTNIPMFHSGRFAETYAKQKRRLATEIAKATEGGENVAGELASEQMAELAQEMLESDQQCTASADPVLNLNNLKDVPFEDFMVLHKIFPKIFMLDMDYRTSQMNKQPSRNALHDQRNQTNSSDFRATMREKVKNKEAINMERALQRRTHVQQQHHYERSRPQKTDAHKNVDQNIKVFNALEAQQLIQSVKHAIQTENSSSVNGQSIAAAEEASTSKLQNEERGYHTIADPASSIVSEDNGTNDYSSNQGGDGVSRGMTPNQNLQMPYQGSATRQKYDNADPSLYTAVQKPTPSIEVSQTDAITRDSQQKKMMANYGSYSPNMMGKPTQQQTAIRIMDASNGSDEQRQVNQASPNTELLSNLHNSEARSSVQQTMRSQKKQATGKANEHLKLTSYEICVQKYTKYMRVCSFERCQMIMKQGTIIFGRDKCRQQFTFNQAVLDLIRKDYDAAIQKNTELYEEICKDLTVRPPAKRIEGINADEEQYFAILTNLIISYMMKEQEGEPQRHNQKVLFELLRDEQLFHVRYTQSQDELNLYKMATFVKNYIRAQQAQRFIDGVIDLEHEENEQEYSVDDFEGAAQEELEKSEQEETFGENAASSEHQGSVITTTEGDGNQVNYSHFKKVTNTKVHASLVHPIITAQQRFQFMQKYVPKYTVPEVADYTPDSADQPTREEQLFQKMRAMKTLQDKQRTKLRDANIKEIFKKILGKDKSSIDAESLEDNFRSAASSAGGSSAQHSQSERMPEVGAREKRRKGKGQKQQQQQHAEIQKSELSPFRIPCESESMFDDFNNLSPTHPGSQLVPKKEKGKREEAAASESEWELVARTESEARELGVDLSFLYSHRKPRVVQNIQKRLLVDILQKQNANKNREQRYRKMSINRQKNQRQFEQNQVQFKEKKELLDDQIMEMQKVQVELIRDGEAVKQVDPLAKQYMALAGSIILLCKEDSIDEIVLEYLAEMALIQKTSLKEAKPEKKEMPYSAALEVLTHSILHIVGKERMAKIEKESLMAVIETIKDMFEEELLHPKAIEKRRSAGIEDVPLLFGGSQQL